MPEGGINAGDPLIDEVINKLEDHDVKYKKTVGSGSKKGDGDVYTKTFAIDICFDGKYVIDPPVNPKFVHKDLAKIKQQAESIGRIGAIVTNTIDEIYVAMTLDDLLDLMDAARKDTY